MDVRSIPGMRVVSGPDAPMVLAHPGVDTVPYGDRYALLSDRLGLDFRAILFTLNHVPLCLRGEAHLAQRAAVARLIAEGKARVTAAIPGVVAESIAMLDRPGSHDVMAECVLPCVDGFLRELIGTDLGLGPESLVSRIFSQSMGVARRRRLEEELLGLDARLAMAFPEDDAQMRGSRIALAVLGRDSLIGTLALSLRHHFAACADRLLSEVPFPTVPTRTGVPYIDRIVRSGGEIAGAHAVPGDVLRCDLKSLEGLSDVERARFFGRGAHVCLGKALSGDLFAELSRQLAGKDRRVAATDFVLREDDVFSMPKTFAITVA